VGLWRGEQGQGSGRGSEVGGVVKGEGRGVTKLVQLCNCDQHHNGEMAALNSEHYKQIDLIPLYTTAHRSNAFPYFMRSFVKGSKVNFLLRFSSVQLIIRNRRIYASYNFQLVISLLAISLGLRFCASRKGGTGGDGRVLGLGNMAASGLIYRKPLVGTGWVGHFSPTCTNGLRKRCSGHVGPLFLAVKLFSRSVGVTLGQEL